ncbi:unnamed protein product [Caenorhabditis brenneri]
MPRFPLLKLPFLCIRCVLFTSECHVLIIFSFLSRKCYAIVNSLITKITGFDIDVNSNRTYILLKIGERNAFGKWIFQDLQENIGDTVLIGGHRMNVCIEETDLCTDTNGNFLNCVYTGIEYIKNLFKKPIYYIKINFDNIPWDKLFRGPEACEYVHFNGNNPVDNEILETILNNIKMTRGINFHVPTHQNFSYNFADIKARGISLKNAHWVTNEMLFASESHDIGLYETRFTSFDCIEFTSTVDRFTRFRFDRNETSDWDEQQRSRYFKWSKKIAFDCETGRDFLREDGMLATVYSVNRHFMFLVFFHPLQTLIMQRQEMQHIQQQGVHRLAQRTGPSIPQQRLMTVRDVIMRHTDFESMGVQVRKTVAKTRHGSMPRTDPTVCTKRPVPSPPVYISPNQRNILRRQQLIQHAQPQQYQNINGTQQVYQKEPSRVLQQVQQQQRQMKSHVIKQQRRVLAPINQIPSSPKISSTRKRPAPTPENVENFNYSPPETTSKQARENTNWQEIGTTEPSQKSQDQQKPHSDGSLPDYVRNIGGFEIRVIRSKDPDMRLFPC